MCGFNLAKPSSIPHVVTLREVAQRFVSLYKRREKIQANGDSSELVFLNIYPSELQLEGTPLIGQLAINERGYVHLRDETAELCVRADAAVANDQYLCDNQNRPLFSGQNMIGHICVWCNWSFAIENIKLNPESTGVDGSNGVKQFNQVHVHISKPALLRVDSTFGGVTQHPFNSTSFVFIVHSQGPAMPRLVSVNGQSVWRSEITAKGVRIKIESDEILHQLHSNTHAECDSRLKLRIDSKNVQFLSLVYCPAELPVRFVAGKAFIICTQNLSKDQRAAIFSDSGLAVYRLNKHEHVHPVLLALNDHNTSSSANSKRQDIARHVPTVQIDADMDTLNRQLQFPAIYSVCDLFASHAERQEQNVQSGIKAACVPESIISVCGIIESRKVDKSVVFAADKRGSGSMDNVAHLGIGQLETHISMHDPNDSTKTVMMYAKLSTYSHPLWLVPGTKVVCRNVVLNVSKHSGNPYLSGTAATSIEEV
ncbi:hypothetical protein IWW36_005411, partial [Coemansia brasiliensis]